MNPYHWVPLTLFLLTFVTWRFMGGGSAETVEAQTETSDTPQVSPLGHSLTAPRSTEGL